jgi:hypothetical protein
MSYVRGQREIHTEIWLGAKGNTYRNLVGKPEGKRTFKRTRHRWEKNITMDLKALRWNGVDRIRLASDRDNWWAVVNTVMNLRFLSNA